MNQSQNFGAVILAAGKGKRMNAADKNKVTMLLRGKPLITYILDLLKKNHVETIVIVVGHAKESVFEAVKKYPVIFAEQREQLGTGDALRAAVEKLPANVSDILVVGGDDSHHYNEAIITKLQNKHLHRGADLTLLTIQVKNPFGLGRVVRDSDGNVIAIVEEKDATEEQRNIQEVNPGCYIFNVEFLKRYLNDVEKSPVTGEYYLTSLVDIAINKRAKISTVQAGSIPWRGINTPEELAEAEQLISK